MANCNTPLKKAGIHHTGGADRWSLAICKVVYLEVNHGDGKQSEAKENRYVLRGCKESVRLAVVHG